MHFFTVINISLAAYIVHNMSIEHYRIENNNKLI